MQNWQVTKQGCYWAAWMKYRDDNCAPNNVRCGPIVPGQAFRLVLAVWGPTLVRKPEVQDRLTAEPPGCRLIWEQTSDLVRSQAALGSGIVVTDCQALLSL
jgi:hypothetical protein